MSKKQAIYDAVRNGASTYAQAAEIARCHDTYVHELAQKDEWLYTQILRNKESAKMERAKRIVKAVDEQKAMGTTWSRMKARCGYTLTQWQRARALTGQST